MEAYAFKGLPEAGVVVEDELLAFRTALIQLNIKSLDPVTDRIQVYRFLKEWLEPLIIIGSRPTLDERHRITAIDVLSIVFNRLTAIHKSYSYDIPAMSEEERSMGNKFVSLFREYYEQASAPLLKSLKDCLTGFVSFGHAAWSMEYAQPFALSIVGSIFTNFKNANFRKGDLYLIELWVKKRWLLPLSCFGSDSTPHFELKTLLRGMGNRTLAPSIGRFLGSLLRWLQVDLKVGEINNGDLKTTWLAYFQKDLAEAMMSSDEQIAINTELYIVPGAFNDDKEGFTLFVQYFLGVLDGPEDQSKYMAVIGCLRTGKEFGKLTESQVDEYVNSLGGYNQLLSNGAGLLRALSLRLMILSPSAALPFPSTYLSTFRTVMDDFFTESDPQVRNEVYSGLRALLERLVASCYAMNKRIQSLSARSKATEIDTSAEIISLQKQLATQREFIKWFLNNLLPAQLQPNTSYQRVVLALRVYSFWLPIVDRGLSDGNPDSMDNLAPDVKLSRNKRVDMEHIILPFDPEVEYSTILRLLVERIMDPYEDIRALASELVKQLQQSREIPWGSILQRTQRMIEDSGRPGQEDGFSRIIEVLHDLSLKDKSIIADVMSSYVTETRGSTSHDIIDIAYLLLEVGVRTPLEDRESRKSRIDNSVLGALALIYKRKDAGTLFKKRSDTDKNALSRVLELCSNIWMRERDILCNESPEGRGTATAKIASGDDSEDEEDQLNNQGFLSYSWRVVSEASSLLGTVTKFTPTACDTREETEAFLSKSGELLIEQLTSIRHRGSLSSIFPALTAVCHQCLTSDLNTLPETWLEKLLKIVSSSGKSITRRSAGLPMALGAILIAELRIKKRKYVFVERTFQSLQETVQRSNIQESPDNDHLELPQVHALNCMRFLFMDSHLADVVEPYVATSIKLAFGCFKSSVWAVRNCGIMLYNAIVHRIFPKDGAPHVLDGARFLERYSGLEPLFHQTLSNGLKDLNDHRLVESMYPALDILSRLTFARSNDPRERSQAEALNELVVSFIGCKIWKIREAAAKSILAFTPSRNHALALVRYFLEWNFARGPRDNNSIHGGLYAAREIYEHKLAATNPDAEGKVTELVLNAADLYLEPDNKVSPINQALFVQLAGTICAHDIEGLKAKILPFCRRALDQAKGSPPRSFAHSLLHKEIAKVMAFISPEIACGYLSFDNPDYGISLSESLTKMGRKVDLYKRLGDLRNDKVESESAIASSEGNPSGELPDSLRAQSQDTTASSLLLNIVNYHEWEHYRVAATNLLLLSTSLETLNPSGLALLATNGSTEPLRESSLILLGKSLGSWSIDKKATSESSKAISTWGQQLFKCTEDEQPYSTRISVLKSIEAASTLMISSTLAEEMTKDGLTPVWLVLHQLLNDDEPDIREAAAECVMQLLGTSSESNSVTPLYAERKLFSHLKSRYAWKNTEVQKILLENILGLLPDHAGNIRKQLVTANTPNTLLFKIEKQNLYRDELRCMERYLDLLCDPGRPNEETPAHLEGGIADNLLTYVNTGLGTIWEIALEHQVHEGGDGGVSLSTGKLKAADGTMGWTTSTEEMFVQGMRVANAFRLLVSWNPELTRERKVEEMVRRFVEYGERDDVKLNNAWLEAFRQGLRLEG